MFFAEVIFCLSLFCIFYPFAIYPILLKIISFFIKTEIRTCDNFEPNITIVISAYNEEENIQNAIISVLNDGYPKEKLFILVGIDGKTDNTNKKIEELQKKYNNIDYHIFEHSGKNGVLNQLIPKVKTDFYIIVDADLRFNNNSNSIKQIISLFYDAKVGNVITSLRLIDANIANETSEFYNDLETKSEGFGENIYQKFETFLKEKESNIKTTVNALGIVACRKEDYVSIPSNRICDDFFRLLQTVKIGKRVIFQKNIIVNEISRKSVSAELKRRERMVSGAFATMWHFKKLFSPTSGIASFFLFSHKLIRYFMPFFLLVAFISTFFISDEILKIALFAIQTLFYFLAILGIILEKKAIKLLPLKILSFFLVMNYGFLRGTIRFFSGTQNSSWNRT